MGNVVGSNIANLFLIISLCAIIKPLKIKKETKYIENPIVILCTAIFYLIVNNDGVITKYEGIALLVMCLLYILYNIVMAKIGNKLDCEENNESTVIQNLNMQNSIDKNTVDENTIDKNAIDKNAIAKNAVDKNTVDKNTIKEKSESESKIETNKKELKPKIKNSLIYCIFQIILGIIALKFGGDFVVDNAVLIAEALGISEKLISLTIVAFGTSLPELITCISATKRGDSDLAIGNIIGSQIFNILLIIGFSATVSPIQGVRGYLDELMILFIGNIIFAILPFIGQKDKIGRASGIAFVSFYFAYMFNLIYENLQR